MLDVALLLRITVDQFAGIEIEPFPAEISRVSLWLVDHLCNREASLEFGQNYARIPIRGAPHPARNINAYLVDAPNVFVESRSKPICDVPEIGMGNQPIDDGNYLFSDEEKSAFIEKEPNAGRFFKPWYGATEFINRAPRHCLWLGDCPPNELRQMPECMKRVEAVRQFRLSSRRASMLKLADAPTRFQTENMPKGDDVVIPEVSSERRRYVPIGFMTPDNLCSNKLRLMPGATIYHFGVPTSSVHMAWMRAVCGRLEMRYDDSIKIVYNNFPWPEASDVQRNSVAAAAQGILDVRGRYPDCSLADLYDETSIPPALRKAHQANGRAVLTAYGFPRDLPEDEIVARLFERLRDLGG